MLCGEDTLVNRAYDQARAVTLRCRSWGCDECAPKRKEQLIGLACRGKPNRFITITVNPARETGAITRAQELVKAWRTIVKLVKEHYGYKSISYFCVFEATKKGEPHLHVLARVGWISQKWLAKQMEKINGAPVCDIRKVGSERHIARYLAKYIGKQPHRFGSCKRYWYTRGWDLDPYKPVPWDGDWSKVWTIEPESIDELRSLWRRRGWMVSTREGLLWGCGIVGLTRVHGGS